jgi:hypothetical protein
MQLLRAVLVFFVLWLICMAALWAWQRLRAPSRLHLKRFLWRSFGAAITSACLLSLIVWLF